MSHIDLDPLADCREDFVEPVPRLLRNRRPDTPGLLIVAMVLSLGACTENPSSSSHGAGPSDPVPCALSLPIPTTTTLTGSHADGYLERMSLFRDYSSVLQAEAVPERVANFQ